MQAQFPALLKQISYPDLLTLLEQVDPNPDSLAGTGAADWADARTAALHRGPIPLLPGDSGLWEPPFTPDQVAALKAGRLRPGLCERLLVPKPQCHYRCGILGSFDGVR